jgi:hypothetical protein
VDVLLLEVDVRQVERNGLRAAQAGRVDQLDEGTVAQRERSVSGEAVECRVDGLGPRRVGQPAHAARRQRCIGDAGGPVRESEQ